MTIDRLDHVTIVTGDLEATRDFYVEVLGLEDGQRPPFTFPGAWLYCGPNPVVHLIGDDEAPPPGTGTFDHVAFRASDYDGVIRRLEAKGVDFNTRTVPDLGLRQIFVHDPNGVQVELNFAASPTG